MQGSTLKPIDFEFQCDASSEDWKVFEVSLESAINQVPTARIELVCRNMKADVDALLGLRASLHLVRSGERVSHGGIISKVVHRGFQKDVVVLTVFLVPAFALLAKRKNCRIFQNQSAKDILQTILSESLSPYSAPFDLAGTKKGKAPREYCVQYDESDLSFAQRLMSEEGINYYFRYDEQKKAEQLVVFDEAHQLLDAKNVDGSNKFPVGIRTAHLLSKESVETVRVSNELASTAVAGVAWDWEKAAENKVDRQGDARTMACREVYRPLARRQDTKVLSDRIEDELKCVRGFERIATMMSSGLLLSTGLRMEISEHPTPGYNGKYVVLQQVTTGSCPDTLLESISNDGMAIDESTRCSTQLFCLPESTAIRPNPVADKPRILGTQTAKVTGPKDGEINVDKHGRIQLQFHWDRRESRDERVSCWVRVAQAWSGTGWGTQFIPRVGMEAVVDFIDGDPERPIVTGTVYNGAHAPAFELPNHRTQSGIRTRSSDGSEGFNELRFEDLKGKEEIFLKAQKDWKIRIGDKKDEQVTGEVHQVYDDLHKLKVAKTQDISVDEKRTVTVKGPQTTHVHGDVEVTYGTKLKHTVGSGGVQLNVDGNLATKSPGKETRAIDKGFKLSASSGNGEVEVSKAFDVKSGTVALTCGVMSIKIDTNGITVDAGPNMITICGTMVKIN